MASQWRIKYMKCKNAGAFKVFGIFLYPIFGQEYLIEIAIK